MEAPAPNPSIRQLTRKSHLISSTKCLVVPFGRVSSRACTQVEVKEKFRRRREARGRRGQGGNEVGQRVASGEGGARAHFRQDVYEVVQTRQVAVLPVPFLPRDVVLQGLALGQGRGFPKVDHPHLGLFLLVVDEEEGAADDLEGSREVRRGRAGALSCPPDSKRAP